MATEPTFRIRQFHPALETLNHARVTARHLLARGPRPLRMLIASDGQWYTSEQQFAPMVRHSAQLARRFGVTFQHRIIGESPLVADSLRRFDLVGVKLCFKKDAATAERIVGELRRATSALRIPLVYFDGDDDPSLQWPQLVESVDLYVKKHVYADAQEYLKPRIGKTNLTDHAARHFGWDFSRDINPGFPGLPQASIAKLHLGWNIGLDDKIEELGRNPLVRSTAPKDVDIGTRAPAAADAWISPMRRMAVEKIEALGGRFRVLAPTDRVSQEKYYEEMLRTRICVSPFGFGELCWRDFEAILCGCLLVKPDMSHLRTMPDIFLPDDCFVPVKWDYSDLEEVCARYLADEDLRRKVAGNALRKLNEALAAPFFVERFAELLKRLDLPAAPRH